MHSRGARRRQPAQRRTAQHQPAQRRTAQRQPGPAGGARGRRQAGERLRRAILAGDMTPGQRLVERIPNCGARVRAITAGQATRRHLHSVIAALGRASAATYGVKPRMPGRLGLHRDILAGKPGGRACYLGISHFETVT